MSDPSADAGASRVTLHNDPRGEPHPEDFRNMIWFVLVAAGFFILYQTLVLSPKMEAAREAREAQAELRSEELLAHASGDTPSTRPRSEVLSDAPRFPIDNGTVFGSISLKGGRIDDLSLHNVYQTLEDKKPVVLLSPSGSDFPLYAEFGWLAKDSSVPVPGPDTLWSVRENSPSELGTGKPVTIFWDNGQGLVFEQTFAIDEDSLFSVTRSVWNGSEQDVELYPYSLVSRHGLPENMMGTWILHEGPIGYAGEELLQKTYNEMRREPRTLARAANGWIGITQKYWITAILPEQDAQKKFRFEYVEPETPTGRALFQTDVTSANPLLVSAGGQEQETDRLYSGMKKISLLDKYGREFGVRHLDLAVDFGTFYFLTKPLFYLLHWLFTLTGNFGAAILILTVLIRLMIFPLANTSFRTFAKMKKISPLVVELRNKYGSEPARLQQELVALYEREKVNPMAGCLPILIQMPIMFSLYKVLFVTAEMRHAPFLGWLQDLSASDPLSVFNLFGLIPMDLPIPLQHVGPLSCLMLLFMLLQQRMQPASQDPVQKQMALMMPFLFTWILAKMPSGLVLYWTFSNMLSVIQQYTIMRMMGVEVSIFRRTPAEEKMDAMIDAGPVVHPELEVLEHRVEEALTPPDENAKDAPSDSKPKSKKKKKT